MELPAPFFDLLVLTMGLVLLRVRSWTRRTAAREAARQGVPQWTLPAFMIAYLAAASLFVAVGLGLLLWDART